MEPFQRAPAEASLQPGPGVLPRAALPAVELEELFSLPRRVECVVAHSPSTCWTCRPWAPGQRRLTSTDWRAAKARRPTHHRYTNDAAKHRTVLSSIGS